MFDFNKVEDFDSHIALSIPSYTNLTEIVLSLSQYFLDSGRSVYDLGCSRGTLLDKMKKVSGVTYYGIDNSSLIPEGHKDVFFINEDILRYPITNACLVTSIFTMQFTHRQHRKDLYQTIKSGLATGGAFIVAEKTYSETGKYQDIINSAYYEYKRQHFTSEEILEKELSLRQNLKSDSYDEIIGQLSLIGRPQEIWRCFNFVAFLVVKE